MRVSRKSLLPVALLTLAPSAFAADAQVNDGDLATAPVTIAPPPSSATYFQYGITFTGEFIADAGPMCADQKVGGTVVVSRSGQSCVLGSGGGVAIRVGVRAAGPWYFGGAYELSKQDPNKLLRLAILQQLRGEARYYLLPGYEFQPYGSAGLGVSGYGNEWGVDTWGPMAFLAAGVETQISRRTVVGLALAYRSLYFGRFTDTSNTERPAGLSHLIGLDLLLEARDPL